MVFRNCIRARFVLVVVLPELYGLYLTPAAHAQSASGLFVSLNDGTIREITPGGIVSSFASGLSTPSGLAFDPTRFLSSRADSQPARPSCVVAL